MTELIISDVNPELNITELCYCTGVSETLLQELVDYGVLVPEEKVDSHEWLFQVTAVETVKKATRIHRDLAIDWAGIALALNLLDDIEKLKIENRNLKIQLSRFSVDEHYE